jgi:SWI/SNF-related matrix-associated actin-dependent regulator 1 of chromatin subfamily A
VQQNGFGDITTTSVTIISYDLATRMELELRERRWPMIICDESHYLKTPTAKRTQVMMQLLCRAKRVVMLSGTPALSRPMELYPQIDAIRVQSYHAVLSSIISQQSRTCT